MEVHIARLGQVGLFRHHKSLMETVWGKASVEERCKALCLDIQKRYKHPLPGQCNLPLRDSGLVDKRRCRNREQHIQDHIWQWLNHKPLVLPAPARSGRRRENRLKILKKQRVNLLLKTGDKQRTKKLQTSSDLLHSSTRRQLGACCFEAAARALFYACAVGDCVAALGAGEITFVFFSCGKKIVLRT